MIKNIPKRSTHLSTIGQIIHRQAAVQLQAQPEVAQAAGQVVLHQDVGALEVTVDDGNLQVQEQRLKSPFRLQENKHWHSTFGRPQGRRSLWR